MTNVILYTTSTEMWSSAQRLLPVGVEVLVSPSVNQNTRCTTLATVLARCHHFSMFCLRSLDIKPTESDTGGLSRLVVKTRFYLTSAQNQVCSTCLSSASRNRSQGYVVLVHTARSTGSRCAYVYINTYVRTEAANTGSGQILTLPARGARGSYWVSLRTGVYGICSLRLPSLQVSRRRADTCTHKEITMPRFRLIVYFHAIKLCNTSHSTPLPHYQKKTKNNKQTGNAAAADPGYWKGGGFQS